MKELGAANGLNDTFVQEQQWKYIRQKQDGPRPRGDMMSSDKESAPRLLGGPQCTERLRTPL